jgi:hypothetical protein
MLIFPSTNSVARRRRKLRDSGHLLLAILLLMAMMIITATYEAPRLIQQMKRDREAEMIHRGTEYARAIKKYYKKFGAYPTTMEQLDNTNNIRFLRKRYKDPLSKDGKWTLLHYNDVIATLVNTGGPGIPAAGLASQGQQALGAPAGQQGSSLFGPSSGSSSAASSGGFGTSSFGSNNSQSAVNQNGIFSQSQSSTGTGQQATSGSPFGPSTGQSATGTDSTGANGNPFGSSASAGPGGTSNPNGATTALGGTQSLGGQTFGAGAIVGVASKSKDPTIRIYNKKKTYDEWQFIYNPVMDQANVLLKGPYSPSTLASSNVGTPAGQLNQQNQQQQSPFGQQNGGYGAQQPGGLNNTQQPPPQSQ